jgi:ABC-type transport system involved in cytochrome bd biosynthesis fused ATPase/permease subunit
MIVNIISYTLSTLIYFLNKTLLFIYNIFYEMSKGKTLLLITHDQALLKSCNRVVRISNGKIVSDKTY